MPNNWRLFDTAVGMGIFNKCIGFKIHDAENLALDRYFTNALK